GRLLWDRPSMVRLGAVGNHDALGDDLRVDPDGGIIQNAVATFPLTITTPNKPGDYYAAWQMLKENEIWFGSKFHLAVGVSPDDPSCQGYGGGGGAGSDADEPDKDFDVALWDGSKVRVHNESSATKFRVTQLVNAADWSTAGNCDSGEGKGLIKGA